MVRRTRSTVSLPRARALDKGRGVNAASAALQPLVDGGFAVELMGPVHAAFVILVTDVPKR